MVPTAHVRAVAASLGDFDADDDDDEHPGIATNDPTEASVRAPEKIPTCTRVNTNEA
jgi:hypothetical protein